MYSKGMVPHNQSNNIKGMAGSVQPWVYSKVYSLDSAMRCSMSVNLPS